MSCSSVFYIICGGEKRNHFTCMIILKMNCILNKTEQNRPQKSNCCNHKCDSQPPESERLVMTFTVNIDSLTLMCQTWNTRKNTLCGNDWC